MLSNNDNPYLPSAELRPVLSDPCLQFLLMSAQSILYSTGCVCSYVVWLATILDVLDISGFLLHNREALSLALLFAVFHYSWIRMLVLATFQLRPSKHGFIAGLLLMPLGSLYTVVIDYGWPAAFISNEPLYICVAQLPLVLLTVIVELCVAFFCPWTSQQLVNQDVTAAA